MLRFDDYGYSASSGILLFKVTRPNTDDAIIHELNKYNSGNTYPLLGYPNLKFKFGYWTLEKLAISIIKNHQMAMKLS